MSLTSQHEDDIPSECEMGTHVLTCLANYCARIRQVVSTAPSHPVVHLPSTEGIVLATDSIVLIAHLYGGDRPLIYSVGYPAACKVLG
jgi:hypothetical protein